MLAAFVAGDIFIQSGTELGKQYLQRNLVQEDLMTFLKSCHNGNEQCKYIYWLFITLNVYCCNSSDGLVVIKTVSINKKKGLSSLNIIGFNFCLYSNKFIFLFYK